MIKMLNDFIEIQPVDPLAADFAFLEMHALFQWRGIGIFADTHAFNFMRQRVFASV